MQAALAHNAGSLAQQRTRLHQALLGAPAGAVGAPSEDDADTAATQDIVSPPEERQVREAEVLAQWAQFMQRSKALQVQIHVQGNTLLHPNM